MKIKANGLLACVEAPDATCRASDDHPGHRGQPGSTAAAPMLLRAVAAVTDREFGGQVLEVARVDVLVTDAGWSVADHASAHFLAGSCTPVDVAGIIWRGTRPDALVGHGVPECQHVFAPALTAGIPWIDTHVLGRLAWPGDAAFNPVRLLERCGVELHPRSGLCRSAAYAELLATLAAAMVGDPEIQALRQEGTDPLGRLVAISRREVAPYGHPPGPWETEEAWSDVPTSSLRYLASAPGASEWEGNAAIRELTRRSREVLIGPSAWAIAVPPPDFDPQSNG